MKQTKILVSQSVPVSNSPFSSLAQAYGCELDFRPMFLIEPLASREFRTQRINILDYSAIVFSSKSAIDAFFHLCEELRVKVPETMKYFCSTESVAKYLQKHIVYRKRKIFFGTGTAESVIAEIGVKQSGEKFLITTSGSISNDMTHAFESTTLDWTPAIFVKPVSQDIKDLDINSYDVIVVYNAADIASLYENFPDFQQGKIKFVSYGKSAVKALQERGLEVAVSAPTTEIPSVVKALDILLGSN